MIIGINLLFLIPNEVGGSEYFARSLLEEIEKQDHTNSYVIFCNRENASTFTFSSPRWKKIVCPIFAQNRTLRILYEQCILPLHVVSQKCDILHSLGYVSPVFAPCRKITTIHDANWKDFPNDTDFLTRTVLNILIGLSALTSKLITTQSTFSANRLKFYYPNLQKKIIVIQPGLNPHFIKLLAKKSKQIPLQKYFLCVSAFYPHKRIPYLLNLWNHLSEIFPNHKLILIGNNGADKPRIESMLKKTNRVEWYAKVSLERLASYYQFATAFIFPSVYEGFGFPVYEALVANIPVFVGSIKPYGRYSSCLTQLTFYDKEDANLILKKLHNRYQKKYKSLPDYETSAIKLIKAYHSISASYQP